MSRPRHALLLLAAGGSRRLGEPKQLLRLAGESLVRRAARLGLATAPAEAVVVCGAHADAVWRELADLPVRRIDCDTWAAGLGDSLATGLRALSGDIDGALVLLCDQPALDAAHLQALRDAWQGDPARAAASAYAGVLGVPALLPRAWFARLAAGGHDQGARDLLRARAADVQAIDAPALAQDLDTPEQARAVTGTSLGANQGEE
ncbi:MAG TPA: nucleotidyltransferase family protein [Arenimonas sp.]|uniref:nucleotidyltransferase family protein n=1 Tax=Arenimonas sp. TaxID=1872635 RepID=UPI002D7F95A6|nr:nucleotidyltransferase family protein [Arenimonas sp.]HEU0152317.1 nucleotidyltransferase family protein [Arenimonas sp.]